VYLDGDTIYGNLKIYSDTLMDKVDMQNKRELSAGMWGDFLMQPGEWEGHHYDGQLINIEFNHVALVQEGRVGKDVKVLDKSDTITTTTNKGFNMSKVAELRTAAQGFLSALEDFLGEEKMSRNTKPAKFLTKPILKQKPGQKNQPKADR